MLEIVRDFVHHGVHVHLYQGLEPVTVGAEKRLNFERHVLLNNREVVDFQNNGPVEEWAQRVRAEIDTNLHKYIRRKVTRRFPSPP